MPATFIPQVGKQYELTAEWTTDLSWAKRNLVLLRNLKYTGKKAQLVGKYYVYNKTTGQIDYDENGKAIVEERFINKTVPNPLFKDDEGNMVPVSVSFPKNSVIELTKYHTSYNGYISFVWLKVITCSDSRFTGRCIEVNLEQFNGVELKEI